MSSPFQQQARVRKIGYIGAIVVLLTASWAVRVFLVETKAEELSLREQSVGEVEVGGSALRLSLIGSRGFVVCALWNWAIDAQKKNRWNELELYVRSLTKLQPHFISPWLFQSWNLAYNVSVEADQVRDKIFYVYRGTALLAEGERQNRNHPELRFSVGFYQQHKICQSDETDLFRSMYQMAAIPPMERDKSRFYTPDAQGKPAFNLLEFEKFCKDHPQLVRRLREKRRRNDPKDIVQFLDDNSRIPSLYSDNRDEILVAFRDGAPAPLKPVRDRFPVLPPKHTAEPPQELGDPNELNDEMIDRITADDFSAYSASRAWYAYAQEPLPPNDPDRPGRPLEITDRVRQRMPKMTVALFRNYPARAQSYIGEMLEAEGWFDEKGWMIKGWFPQDRFSDDKEARVGAGDRAWAKTAWGEAYEMWKQTGLKTGLYMEPTTEASTRALAKLYTERHNLLAAAEPPERPELKKGDKEYDEYKAALRVHWYDYYRTLTNFGHHIYLAEVEADKTTVQARKAFFEAERLRVEGNRMQAIQRFEAEDALEAWRKILMRFQNFRNDEIVQEDSFELEMKYVNLLEDRYGHLYKNLSAVGDALGQGAAPGPGWMMGAALHVAQAGALPLPEAYPEEKRRFDNTFKDHPEDPDDKPIPILNDEIKRRVLTKFGRIKELPPSEEEIAKMMERRRQSGQSGGRLQPLPPPPKPGVAPMGGPSLP